MEICIQELESLPGVEVHHSYPSQGRLILVQETSTVAEQKDGLRRIQVHPEVLMAELVYHYAGESDPATPGDPVSPADREAPAGRLERGWETLPGTVPSRPQEGDQGCE
jgi:nitrate reductase NapD